MSLLEQLAEHLGTDTPEARAALDEWVQHLRRQAQAEGWALVPGLGIFRLQDDQLLFEPEESLARLVNSRFAGLEVLSLNVVRPSEGDGKADEAQEVLSAPPAAAPAPPPAPARDLPEEPPVEAHEAALEESPADAHEPTPDVEAVYPEPAAEHVEDRPPERPLHEQPAPITVDDPDADAAGAPSSDPWRTAAPAAETGAPPGADTGADLAPAEPVVPADDVAEAAAAPPPETPVPAPPTPAPSPQPAAREAQRPPRPRTRAPEEAKRSRGSLLLIGLLLLAGFAAVLYFLNRPAPQPAERSPAVAEQQPPPAPDDATAGSTPGADPSAAAPDLAEGPAAAETEPAEEPPASPAPSDAERSALHGADGIDRAVGGYTLVVSSSTERQIPEAVIEPFRGQGYRVDILQEASDGTTRYRAALGQFPTSEEAVEARDELAGTLPEGTWVLRIRPDM